MNKIHSYILQNEGKLKIAIDYYRIHGEDETLHDELKKLNINSLSYRKGNYHFNLYKFLGYGYGITYTDSSSLIKPETSPGGSPIIKWFKLNRHWYYYSYFD